MNDAPVRQALLIGVSDYDDDQYHDVPAARNSVRAMREMLTNPALCGWSEESVEELINPKTLIEVGKPLQDLAEQKADVFLLYFVGHGYMSDKGDLYFILGSSTHRELIFSGLTYNSIREVLKRSRARKKIVILDCCYSGKAIETLAGEDVAFVGATDVSGAYTLTAADGTAHVPNAKNTDSLTSFTRVLTETVRHGVQGGGEFLRLTEIYDRLTDRLRAEELPRANQRGTDSVANFEFSRNPAFKGAFADARTIGQQLPDSPEERQILKDLQTRFSGNKDQLLGFAVEVWKRIEPSSGNFRFVRVPYDRTYLVRGDYILGAREDSISLDFYIDVDCGSVDGEWVGVDSVERLTSSIRNSHFGVFFTLGYVAPAEYQRIRSDGDPIIVVCGSDIVEILAKHEFRGIDAIEEWVSVPPVHR